MEIFGASVKVAYNLEYLTFLDKFVAWFNTLSDNIQILPILLVMLGGRSFLNMKTISVLIIPYIHITYMCDLVLTLQCDHC